MKKLLKNFLIVNSQIHKLSNFKFFYFYPIQIFRNGKNKSLSKICFNGNFNLNNLKYPLHVKIFDLGKKLLLSLSSKNNPIFVRYQNFFFLHRIKTRIMYFNFHSNFFLFSNNLVLILIFFSFLQKLTSRHMFFIFCNKNFRIRI